MNIRDLLFLVGLFVGCAVLGITDKASADEKRPNVIMILSDDQAWGDYSFMNHPHIQTPRLDELAKSSLTFTRGYVPDSLCRPSLATIISGLYPDQHGIVGNDPPVPEALTQRRPKLGPGAIYRDPEYVAVRNAFLSHADQMTTLPEYLKPHGYRSLQTGKWWAGHYSRGGFDEGMTSGNFAQDGRHCDVGLDVGRKDIAPMDAPKASLMNRLETTRLQRVSPLFG